RCTVRHGRAVRGRPSRARRLAEGVTGWGASGWAPDRSLLDGSLEGVAVEAPGLAAGDRGRYEVVVDLDLDQLAVAQRAGERALEAVDLDGAALREEPLRAVAEVLVALAAEQHARVALRVVLGEDLAVAGLVERRVDLDGEI